MWHLGVGRDLTACALIELCEQFAFAAGAGDTRLKEATRRLKLFAKERHLCLRLKKLTKTKINWVATKYPELILPVLNMVLKLLHIQQPKRVIYVG